MIRVIIVDDEPLAREGVSLLLAPEADVEILAECEDGVQALQQINSLRPDLVFLDINMPGLSGFEVLSRLDAGQLPLITFLTAYDEFAIAAFAANALDYLLKPVSEERFRASLQRARQALQNKSLTTSQEGLSTLLKSWVADNKQRPERLMIRNAGQIFFLNPVEVIWVQAEGDYVTIHTAERAHLIRETMKNMEQKLEKFGFQRIHRSSLVNLDHIQQLSVDDNGDYSAVLQNGTSLKISRSAKEVLFERLSRNADTFI